jgi:hypothetical protein
MSYYFNSNSFVTSVAFCALFEIIREQAINNYCGSQMSGPTINEIDGGELYVNDKKFNFVKLVVELLICCSCPCVGW